MKLDVQSLRKEAERRFAEEEGPGCKLPTMEALPLQHELGGHEIELELQSEELHRPLRTQASRAGEMSDGRG